MTGAYKALHCKQLIFNSELNMNDVSGYVKLWSGGPSQLMCFSHLQANINTLKSVTTCRKTLAFYYYKFGKYLQFGKVADLGFVRF